MAKADLGVRMEGANHNVMKLMVDKGMLGRKVRLREKERVYLLCLYDSINIFNIHARMIASTI